MRQILKISVFIVLIFSAYLAFGMRGQVIRDGFYIDSQWGTRDSGTVFVSDHYPMDSTGYTILSDSFSVEFIDISSINVIAAADTDTVILNRNMESEVYIWSSDSIVFYLNEFDSKPCYIHNNSITFDINHTVRRILFVGLAASSIVNVRITDKKLLK